MRVCVYMRLLFINYGMVCVTHEVTQCWGKDRNWLCGLLYKVANILL